MKKILLAILSALSLDAQVLTSVMVDTNKVVRNNALVLTNAASVVATNINGGLLSDGTNRRRRMLSEIANDWINVLSFEGVDNTGAFDTHTSVQRAAYVASANSVPGRAGGTLFFPPGTYDMDETLFFTNSLRILGSGPGTELRFRGTNNFHGISHGTTNNLSFLVIEDIKITDVLGSKLGAAINVQGVSYADFSRVIVDAAYGFTNALRIISFDTNGFNFSQALNVSDCHWRASNSGTNAPHGNAAVFVSGLAGHINFDGGHVGCDWSTNVYRIENTGGIHIQNQMFQGQYLRAIWMDVAGHDAYNTITGNHFESSSDPTNIIEAIYTRGRGTVIYGNSFSSGFPVRINTDRTETGQFIVDGTHGAGELLWTGEKITGTNGNSVAQFSVVYGKTNTAAAPTFAFILDPDTGMYRYSTNAIGFGAAGTHVMYVSNGIVSVSGQVHATSYRFPSSTGFYIQTGGTTDLEFGSQNNTVRWNGSDFTAVSANLRDLGTALLPWRRLYIGTGITLPTGDLQTLLNAKQSSFTTGIGVTNIANVLSANLSAGPNITLTPGSGGVIQITAASFLNDPGANGILVRSAMNTTLARAILGTAGQIEILNGDGISGNPTILIPLVLDLSGKTSVRLPTSASPSVSTIGMIGADSDYFGASRGAYLGYDGTENTFFVAVRTASAPTDGQVPTWDDANKRFVMATPPGSGSGSNTFSNFGGGYPVFNGLSGIDVQFNMLTNSARISWDLTANLLTPDLITGSVNNTFLANMPAETIKANITGGAAAPQDVPYTQFKDALGLTNLTFVEYFDFYNYYTTDNPSPGNFAHSAPSTNENGVTFKWTVPEDIDNTVDLKVTRFKVIADSGGDDGAIDFAFGMKDIADSNTISPLTYDNWIGGTLTPSSSFSQDVFTLSDITLTGWRSALTPGHTFLIRVQRSITDANSDNFTWLDLRVQYARKQRQF